MFSIVFVELFLLFFFEFLRYFIISGVNLFGILIFGFRVGFFWDLLIKFGVKVFVDF